MCCRRLGAQHWLQRSRHNGFPHFLWRLVNQPELAAAVLAHSGCRMDKFTRWFLGKFNTVERLQRYSLP
jgi:recombinational DNA repair protein (RecF pathway)